VRRQAGFTLLEILVALLVFGFLIAGLSQTTRFGLTAWRTEGRLADTNIDMEATDRVVRLIIRNMAPSDDPTVPSIAGSSRTMTGISRMPIPSAGLREMPVEVGIAVSGNRLVLRWRPYEHVQPIGPQARPQEATLVSGIERIGIEYWVNGTGWTGTWKQPDLPALVRIRVRPLNAKPWPDIVASPKLSVP
jgi:general secretion pathway protein J